MIEMSEREGLLDYYHEQAVLAGFGSVAEAIAASAQYPNWRVFHQAMNMLEGAANMLDKTNPARHDLVATAKLFRSHRDKLWRALDAVHAPLSAPHPL